MTNINKAIESAQKRIREFCKINNIHLNEDILKLPVMEVEEYLKEGGYEDKANDQHISREEIMHDLNGSEAYVLEVDEKSQQPVIIYLKDRIEQEDFDGQVVIFIHEFLHYVDLKLCRLQDDELEAEVEVLAMVIALYYDRDWEDGLDELSIRFQVDRATTKKEKNFCEVMLRKMFKMSFDDIQERLVA